MILERRVLHMISGLPDKLKELRWKYNLTQKAVAEKLNVSPSIISSYEVGERTPSLENILVLARLYHCTTDYLLGNDAQVSQIILDTSQLTDEQIHALQTFINTIPPTKDKNELTMQNKKCNL